MVSCKLARLGGIVSLSKVNQGTKVSVGSFLTARQKKRKERISAVSTRAKRRGWKRRQSVAHVPVSSNRLTFQHSLLTAV